MATTTWEYGSRLIDKGLSSGTASGSLTLNSNSGFQTKLNEIPANTKITLVKLYATLFSSLSTNDYTVKLNGTTIASDSNVLTSATPTKLDIDITKYAETETVNAGNINGDLYVSIGPGFGTKVCEDIKIIWTYNLPNHTITAIPNNSSYGTVTGGGTYEERKVITLTATPKTGYQFSHWSDDENNTSATRQVTVGTSDATYTAIFVQKNITFKVTSNDYGKVELYYTPYNSSTQQGPFTGRNLSYTLQEGSTIRLTAIPNPECYLVAWGDSSTSTSKSLTLTSNVATQSANFRAYIDGSGTCKPTGNSRTNFTLQGGYNSVPQMNVQGFLAGNNSLAVDTNTIEKYFILYGLDFSDIENYSNLTIKSLTITTDYSINDSTYFEYKITPITQFYAFNSNGTGDRNEISTAYSIPSGTSHSYTWDSSSELVTWINNNQSKFFQGKNAIEGSGRKQTFGFYFIIQAIQISSLFISVEYEYTNNYTINAIAKPSTAGSVSGAGTYHKGLEINLIADAVDNQYEFSHWNEEIPPDKLTDKGYKTVYATPTYAATTYVAHFVPKFINEIYIKEKLSDSLWLGDSEITQIWVGSDIIVYGYK